MDGASMQGGSLMVITGAGISADSGIPTYRGPGGCYEDDPELPRLLTADGLRQRPDELWRHIDRKRALVQQAQPNEAHQILARWEHEGRFARFLLVTQNVDGLHTRAGSDRVTEIHGSLWRLAAPRSQPTDLDSFFAPGADREALVRRWSFDNERRVWSHHEVPFDTIPPSDIDGARPDIVFFDEDYGNRLLWAEHFLCEGCDTLLVVGCSGTVAVLDYLVRYARRRNADLRVVNVNPHEDALADTDEGNHRYLRATAIEGLQQLDAHS